MGLMVLSIIEYVYALIFLLGVAAFILEVGCENRHVGRAGLSLLDHSVVHQTPLIAFNFSGFNSFCYVIFSENLEFYECTRQIGESLH